MTNLRVNLKKEQYYASRFDFLIHHYREGRILDVGNVGGLRGQGKSHSSYLKLKQRISSTSTLYGFDLYEPGADVSSNFPNQVKGDLAGGAPFKGNSFDTLYAGQILEHMGNPLAVLKECCRLLKPGGRFVLDVPNPYALKRMLKWLVRREETWGDPTHMIMFTPTSLKALLLEAGFRIIQLTSDGKIGLPWLFGKAGLGVHLLCCAEKI